MALLWRCSSIASDARYSFFLVAVGTIAELGDLRRFDHPRKLMAYLGLVPKENSSGDNRKQGGITQCGNGRARRLLIEGAQTYKHNANVSTELQKRQETLPKVVIDIAWKAQLSFADDTNA